MIPQYHRQYPFPSLLFINFFILQVSSHVNQSICLYQRIPLICFLYSMWFYLFDRDSTFSLSLPQLTYRIRKEMRLLRGYPNNLDIIRNERYCSINFQFSALEFEIVLLSLVLSGIVSPSLWLLQFITLTKTFHLVLISY